MWKHSMVQASYTATGAGSPSQVSSPAPFRRITDPWQKSQRGCVFGVLSQMSTMLPWSQQGTRWSTFTQSFWLEGHLKALLEVSVLAPHGSSTWASKILEKWEPLKNHKIPMQARKPALASYARLPALCLRRWRPGSKCVMEMIFPGKSTAKRPLPGLHYLPKVNVTGEFQFHKAQTRSRWQALSLFVNLKRS